MQIVIDLDAKTIHDIKSGELFGLSASDIWEIAAAIRKGETLPKKHGRLIDADALPLHQNEHPNEYGYHFCYKKDIDGATTLVEPTEKGHSN